MLTKRSVFQEFVTDFRRNIRRSDNFSSSNLQICQQSTGEKDHEILSMRRKGGFPMYKAKPCLLSASGTSEMAATMRVILLVAAMAVVVFSPAGTRAQLSSCTSVILRLSPCLDYITGNVSTPSSQCCSQFASAARSDPQCICALITSGISAAPSFGITVNQTQAFALPGACSVQFPLSQCNSNAPMASPPISSLPPPGLPTSNGNAVEFGMPLLVSLLAAAVYSLVAF